MNLAAHQQQEAIINKAILFIKLTKIAINWSGIGSSNNVLKTVQLVLSRIEWPRVAAMRFMPSLNHQTSCKIISKEIFALGEFYLSP